MYGRSRQFRIFAETYVVEFIYKLNSLITKKQIIYGTKCKGCSPSQKAGLWWC